MPQFSEVVRPFWLQGLNQVSGPIHEGFSLWVLEKKFQVYDPPVDNKYFLSAADRDEVLRAFAYDCSRLASAAFESVLLASPSTELPRAISWLLINHYYAAFFAAHAILRMLGHTVSQFDAPHVQAVDTVSALYGVQVNLSTGYHLCSLNATSKLSGYVMTGRGGVHEAFWREFKSILNELVASVLATNLPANKDVGAKLIELLAVMSSSGCNGGNWLSYVRNFVNYRQEFGAWFPYREQKRATANRLFEIRQKWINDPMDIDLAGKLELEVFLSACVFLVAWCREMVFDMVARSPDRKSFFTYGPVQLMKVAGVA